MYIMNILLVALLAWFPIISNAQQAEFKIPIWFTDSCGVFTYSPNPLLFGLHPQASICIDDSLGEFFMFTECGLFSQRCAEFYSPNRSCTGGNFPVFLDLRKSWSPTQVDTYKVVYYGTAPVVLHWPSNLSTYYDSCTLFSIPRVLTVNMLSVDSSIVPTNDENWGRLMIRTVGPKTPTGVAEINYSIPTAWQLSYNYPNPFNPNTTISYQIPTQNHVMLKVFDMLGREVATLINRVEEPGYKSVNFDASRLASGVYYYRLVAGDPSLRSGQVFVQTEKMILMK